MTEEEKKVKIKVDGRELEVPISWTIIRACHSHGIDIPHYCYHQDLSIAGNCRICMVKVAKQPRPVVACATPVMDGMEVDTKSDEVVQARKAVMEFLLINHPLDCPECDQAGECRLQDYSYKYGRDHGRFHEDKVTRKKATFGPHVKYWGSRCIVCTRCVRFTDEVSGTHELAVINRGDKSEISLFPGRALDNPLSLNTVDVCPVGALVSADFLYQSRVWYMHSAPSICPDCSLGCSTRVDMDKQSQIKRIIPRRNDLVNKEWMCDYGRLSFPYVTKDRVSLPLFKGKEIPWVQAFEEAAKILNSSRTSADGLSVLASAWMTNEASAELLELSTTLLTRIFGFGNPIVEDRVFPGFTISGDKNPNWAGLRKVLGDRLQPGTPVASSGVPALVISGIPNFKMTPDVRQFLDDASSVVLVDFAGGELAAHRKVDLIFPSLTHFEKSGTSTNRQGMQQTFAPVMEPVGYGRSEAEILNSIVRTLAKVPTGARA